MEIDGQPINSLNSKPVGGASSGSQCIPTQIFSQGGLADMPHLIIVKNGVTVEGASAGGTLEFNSIT